MKKQKLHRLHERMIMDFTGALPIGSQPKKASEFDKLLRVFKETNKEQYDEAYEIIVNKKVEGGDNTALVASKVSELVESNMQFQESSAINSITDSFMKQIEVSGESIKELAKQEIEEAKKEFHTIKVQVGNKKPKRIKGVVCEQFEHLLQLAQERINIMMVGPAGSGKTHIAGQLANALRLDYASQSCSAGMSESQLTGWLLPIGKSGSFQYVSSEFIRIYENGGIFLFDEMDAADPNVLIFINQALANGRFSLPQRFEKPLVEKHPDFVAVAAANTFGGGADAMYHARNALDAATLDRFKMGLTPIDYSPVVEERLVDSEVLEWGIKVRKIIFEHGMRKIMSTRVMRDASTMKSGQKWNIERIAKSYFSDWTKEEMAIIEREMKKYEEKEIGGPQVMMNGKPMGEIKEGAFEAYEDVETAKRRAEERKRNKWKETPSRNRRY